MVQPVPLADRLTVRALRLGLASGTDPASAARSIIELADRDRPALQLALARIQRANRDRRGRAADRAAWYLRLALTSVESPELSLLS